MSTTLDIAIVGLAGCYAGARDTRAYWQNILDKVDSIEDASPEWAGPYLDVDNAASRNDRIYTTKGGFLRDLAEIDPAQFGVMPSTADGGEPDHLLALKHAHDALADAGYVSRAFNRERAGIVLGRGTYTNRGMAGALFHTLFMDQALDLIRSVRPDLGDNDIAELRSAFKKQLPPYGAEQVGPLTPNVITGMIANRLDLMGPNFIVDAACASSLIAIDLAVRELTSGRCDLMLTGGVHAHTPPQLYVQFCQINALAHGKLRPFATGCDGTLLGEGVGVLVLKRLADAERDGDRIYAVIKGIGTASDGKAKGLLTPRLEGEVLALKRAYESSGIDPATIGLIEAHGTGTMVGDRTEIEALTSVFGPRSGALPDIALGTVKSMISHCLPASGSAAMIKTALALFHKVLPPTLCEEPSPALNLDRSPLYINNETRPWIHGGTHPRRAGVNAFGFGGINAHVILEEYRPSGRTAQRTQVSVLRAPSASEVVVLAADSALALAALAESVLARMRGVQAPNLAEVAKAATQLSQGAHRLGLVCSDEADLTAKLEQAISRLQRADAAPFKTRGGIYYGSGPVPGRVCFLFPGEGSQYSSMVSDLCLQFPQVREWFDFIETVALKRGVEPRAPILFPPPTGLDEATRRDLDQKLFDIDVAAELVFAASMGLLTVFDAIGLRADAMLGHSTGENTAMVACGVQRLPQREQIADAIGDLNRMYREVEAAGALPSGSLLTIGALRGEARQRLLANPGNMTLAMDNCPNQLVMFGSAEDAQALRERLASEGAICAELPFGRPYHTQLFKPVADAYRNYYEGLDFGPGRAQLYSACAAAPFPEDPAAIRELATAQWDHPVRFVDTVERLYADGVRVFIEIGPSGNLTSFVGDILRERHDVVAVASNSRRRAGTLQLNHALAQVYAAGVTFRPEALYTHREIADVDLSLIPRLPLRQKPKLKLLMPEMRVPEGWKPMPETARVREPLAAAHSAVAVAPSQDRSMPAAAISAPGTSIPAAEPIVDPRLQAVQAHFSLMQEFLESQARVLGLSAPGVASAAVPIAPAPIVGDASYPLLGRIVERSADRLVCERSFDCDTDLFLRDHAVGKKPSDRQPELLALTVVPFTFSMEILEQAAACLAAGSGGESLKVTGIEDARGHRWLGLDEGRLDVRIVAERSSSGPARGHVLVRIFNQAASGVGLFQPLFEGRVLLDAQYPKAPEPRAWSADAAHTARNNTDSDLYLRGMFHGPRLRGVRRLRRWANEAIECDLQTIPTTDYFSFTRQPRFQLDAALLDAAGQLAGFWLTETRGWGENCFPYHVGQFVQYADPPPAGTQVLCRGHIRGTAQHLEAQFDLIDEQGRLIARASGWEDRIFSVSARFHEFRLDPQVRALSLPWMQDLLSATNIVARRLEPFGGDFFDQGWGVWKRVLANMVLSTAERKVFYQTLPPAGPRRQEWLLGRITAKEAVREWAPRNRNLPLAPADIEIAALPSGQAYVQRCHGLPPDIALPSISISRSAQWTCAICGPADTMLGVDYQRLDGIDSDMQLESAFSEAEAAPLRELAAEPAKRLAAALWSAKRAAAKAAGTGLEGRPQEWQLASFEGRADGKLMAQVHRGARSYRVEIQMTAEEVFAVCVTSGAATSASNGLQKRSA